MGAYRDTFLLNKTLELKNKYNTNLFIETGTNDGDSLKILSQHFYALYSCELFENSYNIFLHISIFPYISNSFCNIMIYLICRGKS